MQLIRRMQVSQQFDCLFINWKWIFSLCCSFAEGTSAVDNNSSEDKRLIPSAKNDPPPKVVDKRKKWSDEISLATSSIPPTEEDEKPNWRKIEDLDSDRDMDVEDKGTIAAEDFEKSGEASKRDDDNRSDNSDERIDKFGTVVVNFNFEMMKNTLYLDIEKVEYLPSKVNGGPSGYQMFVKIFNEAGRTLKKWHSPMFRATKFPKQSYEYSDLSQKDIQTTAVRLRLYGCERKRRDKLLSESIVGMGSVNFRKKDSYRIRLEKRADIKLISKEEIEVVPYSDTKLKTVKGTPLKSLNESDGSTTSLQSSLLFTTKSSLFKQNPFNTMDEDNYFTSEASKKAVVKVEEVVGNQSELLVGLGYNGITSRITVEVVKGNSFKNPLARGEEKLPHPFVKITLFSKESQIIAKSKTTVRYNQANPLFKEKFMFQIPQFQLVELSIIFGVYHKKSTHRKELMGWSSVGLNNTTEEEKSHWKGMMEAKGEISYQWHLLQPSNKSRHGFPGAD